MVLKVNPVKLIKYIGLAILLGIALFFAWGGVLLIKDNKIKTYDIVVVEVEWDEVVFEHEQTGHLFKHRRDTYDEIEVGDTYTIESSLIVMHGGVWWNLYRFFGMIVLVIVAIGTIILAISGVVLLIEWFVENYDKTITIRTGKDKKYFKALNELNQR